MKYKDIKVGLGLVLIRNEQVLLARRKLNANGLGEFGGPGGALLPGESFEESIRRELAEECGPDVEITNLRMVCAINYRNGKSSTHWVGIGFVADYARGEIKLMEPDKHDPWQWYDLKKLPEPMYWPAARYIEAYRTNTLLFEL